MIVGLDLSLTKTAACAVPTNWALDWRLIRTMTKGHKLPRDATVKDVVGRLQTIEWAVLEFVDSARADAVVVEDYAYSARVSHAHSLGELGGVIKCALVHHGYPVEIVAPASARKLLGKAPRKDSKIWAAQKLYAMGAPKSWSLDECDAFLVANHYLSGCGGDAIALAA